MVGASNAFITAAARGVEYEPVDPRCATVAGRLYAPDVFERIATTVWRSGDPGLAFLDTVYRANPTPHTGPS